MGLVWARPRSWAGPRHLMVLNGSVRRYSRLPSDGRLSCPEGAVFLAEGGRGRARRRAVFAFATTGGPGRTLDPARPRDAATVLSGSRRLPGQAAVAGIGAD